MQGASREYNIPKSAVEAFDGSELYISIPFSEVLRYKVSWPLLSPSLFLNLASKATMSDVD
jgi:hypothetical protein